MEHSTEFPDSFHRVTIKGLCVRDGKILMIKESESWSGKWELPGGGLDFGEEIHAALKREIEEEMGLKVSRVAKRPLYVWTYKYKAKRNLEWYYSFVVAYPIEFEDLNFTPTPECEEIEFFSKDELRQIGLDGQVTDFAELFNPDDFKESF